MQIYSHTHAQLVCETGSCIFFPQPDFSGKIKWVQDEGWRKIVSAVAGGYGIHGVCVCVCARARMCVCVCVCVCILLYFGRR
jgi:hypothetical protein